MSSADSNAPAQSPQAHGRREFLKRAAVSAGGVGAIGAGGAHVAPRFSPMGRADALACGGICIGAGVGAGLVAAGWLLRDKEIIGKDDPPEGLTADALHQQVHQIATTRQSNNKSTFIDNRNIVETGFSHSLYAEGKKAAVEALNDQLSQSEVQTAATDAADMNATTVLKNILKSWNESVNELMSMDATLADHPDTNPMDVFLKDPLWGDAYSPGGVESRDITHTLPDGTDFTVKEVVVTGDGYGGEGSWTPVAANPEYDTYTVNYEGIQVSTTYGTFTYLKYGEWTDIYSLVKSTLTNVKDGLITWVDSVYSQVQAGELDPAELFTPRELAEMGADSETIPQALMDLAALNIPVDFEREAEIYLPDDGSTLTGRLAVSSEPSSPIQAGDTINPSQASEDYYLTYDVSQTYGKWDDYNEGIDGGVLTFTAEPWSGTIYRVTTTAGESVDVTKADFTDQGDGTWTVDLSADLEQAITSVSSVEAFAESDQTQYQTVMLDETFTVKSITDGEGNEQDEINFEDEEPHNDTNYITEAEWKDLYNQQQKLIEKYEESQNSGGGWSWPWEGGGGYGDWLFGGIVVVGVAWAFGQVTN